MNSQSQMITGAEKREALLSVGETPISLVV